MMIFLLIFVQIGRIYLFYLSYSDLFYRYLRISFTIILVQLYVFQNESKILTRRNRINPLRLLLLLKLPSSFSFFVNFFLLLLLLLRFLFFVDLVVVDVEYEFFQGEIDFGDGVQGFLFLLFYQFFLDFLHVFFVFLLDDAGLDETVEFVQGLEIEIIYGVFQVFLLWVELRFAVVEGLDHAVVDIVLFLGFLEVLVYFFLFFYCVHVVEDFLRGLDHTLTKIVTCTTLKHIIILFLLFYFFLLSFAI